MNQLLADILASIILLALAVFCYAVVELAFRWMEKKRKG